MVNREPVDAYDFFILHFQWAGLNVDCQFSVNFSVGR